MLNAMFKSIIEQDRNPVVICDLQHIIVYMNPAAVANYAKRGGASLLGQSLLDCHNENSNRLIKEVVAWFEASTENNMIYTYKSEEKNKDEYMVALRDEEGKLIGYYEKHESRNPETAERYDYSKSLV